MNYATLHKKNEQKDRRNSIIITMLIVILAFLVIYFYKFTKNTSKPEVITTMLINFGDQKNGQQSDEVMPQTPPKTEIPEEKQPQPETLPIPKPEKIQPKEVEKEKVLTGKNEKISAPKTEKSPKVEKKENIKNKTNTPIPKEKTTKKENIDKKSTINNIDNSIKKSETSTPKPNDAVGNLIRGRGNKASTQGNSQQAGNSGDPLGSDTNGDSKIGVDRKLVAFIPGTMGRGGVQPTHSCSVSGTITISFIVDKAGNVISAHRIGGISDACAVSTTISWVKKYVKAEKSTTSSTGTYSITF